MVEKGVGLAVGARWATSDEELVKVVQRAEDLGYAAVFLGEAWGRDSITTLTMFACHTSRIKIATGIVPVYSRTPAALAMTAASLDSISKGRFILGLGASGSIVVEQWHGIPFGSPLQRTREYVEIIRMALSGERVNYEGRYFHLQRFRIGFQGPSGAVPIYIAGFGPRNVALTGEVADGWIPNWVDLAYLPKYKEQLEEGARRAGRNVEDVTIAPYVPVSMSKDVEEARQLLRGRAAFYIGGMGVYYQDMVRRYGFEDEVARIVDLWNKRDREGAAAQVTDEMLDRIGITGDADQCRRKLQAYRDAGVHLPVLDFPEGTTPGMIYSALEALAPDGNG